MAKEIDQLKRAVRRLIKASVASSWAGSAPPEDRTGIQQELESAIQSYQVQLDKLERIAVSQKTNVKIRGF